MRNNLERLGTNMQQQDAGVPPQQTTEQTNLNFIVPTEHISLPSKGLFYPANHPLHGATTIEIKQMTAKEEDILTSRNLLKKGVALDKLIQSLIVDKRINCDSLTIEDRSAIVLAARISAYGSEYATVVTCPSCNEKSKSKFDLLEKLEGLDSDMNEPPAVDPNGLFTITLPLTKWNVKCRALNGYDEKILLRLTDAKKNVSEADSLLIEQLKMMVVSIDGIEDKALLDKAISGMPARDSRFLRSSYQELVKGIDMRHSYSCSKCDYSGYLEVPLTTDFFWFK